MSTVAWGRNAWRHVLSGLLLAGLISAPVLAASSGRAKPAPSSSKATKPAKPGKPVKAAAGVAKPAQAGKPAGKPAAKAPARAAPPGGRNAASAKAAPAKLKTAPAGRSAVLPLPKARSASSGKPLPKPPAKPANRGATAKSTPAKAGSSKAAAAPATKPGKTKSATQAQVKTAPRRDRLPVQPKPVLAANPAPDRTNPIVAAIRRHVQTQPPLTLGPLTVAGNASLPYPLGNATVKPTPGTTVSEGYIASGGLARRYIVIKPDPPSEGAPVLVLLHASTTTPEIMANVTRAGRLAADYGAWVYLPAAIGEHWNDSPAALVGVDDVSFIRTLIDSAVKSNRLDASRVFVAGYSNGGFMAERVACELSSRIAGGASIAATFRDAMVARCQPTHPMPFALFQGTADILVPYRGQLTLQGARQAFDQWGSYSNCTGSPSTTALPDVDPYDGTRVSLTRSGSCRNGSEIRLYTILNGGHTWPNSDYTLSTLELGLTTRDIDATTELWKFMTGFSLN